MATPTPLKAMTDTEEGDERDPRLHRGVPEQELQVLGEREHEAARGEGQQDDRQAGTAEVTVAEQRQRQHRRRTPSFPAGEGGQRHHRHGERPCRLRRGPAVLRGGDDPPDERRHPGRGQERAADVRPAGRAARLGDDQQCGDHPEHGDRDVEQEHRPPPEVLQQQATDDFEFGLERLLDGLQTWLDRAR
jgi:hypothetical protein